MTLRGVHTSDDTARASHPSVPAALEEQRVVPEPAAAAGAGADAGPQHAVTAQVLLDVIRTSEARVPESIGCGHRGRRVSPVGAALGPLTDAAVAGRAALVAVPALRGAARQQDDGAGRESGVRRRVPAVGEALVGGAVEPVLERFRRVRVRPRRAAEPTALLRTAPGAAVLGRAARLARAHVRTSGSTWCQKWGARGRCRRQPVGGCRELGSMAGGGWRKHGAVRSRSRPSDDLRRAGSEKTRADRQSRGAAVRPEPHGDAAGALWLDVAAARASRRRRRPRTVGRPRHPGRSGPGGRVRLPDCRAPAVRRRSDRRTSPPPSGQIRSSGVRISGAHRPPGLGVSPRRRIRRLCSETGWNCLAVGVPLFVRWLIRTRSVGFVVSRSLVGLSVRPVAAGSQVGSAVAPASSAAIRREDFRLPPSNRKCLVRGVFPGALAPVGSPADRVRVRVHRMAEERRRSTCSRWWTS